MASKGIERVRSARAEGDARACKGPERVRSARAEGDARVCKGTERVKVETRRREAPASAAPAELRALPEAEQM